MATSTWNCIGEQLENQRRTECTEGLQKAGILRCFCAGHAPKHFPAFSFGIFSWTSAAKVLLETFPEATESSTQPRCVQGENGWGLPAMGVEKSVFQQTAVPTGPEEHKHRLTHSNGI